MNRYVIVGTGVAGISAAQTLRERDQAAEISLVTSDPHGFYSRPGLAYYLTDEIPEKQLSIYSKKDWKDLDARIMHGHALRIDPQNHRLEIQHAAPLGYDRLLLATGASAAPLEVAGADLRGVVKLDDYEDARQILGMTRHASSAVVVGGGIVAMELVEGLRARRLEVHYFLRGERYWSNVLDEAESHIVENRLAEDGVHLHYKTEIAEILGRGGAVAGVRTQTGYVLPCQIVATAIGVKPRLELAQSAGLAVERGILTDVNLQTSQPDIFAAGDVAQVWSAAAGRAVIDNLWTPGREQGRTAARNMAGDRQPYQRGVALNVLRLAGVMVSVIGSVASGRDGDLVSVARGSSETWQQLPNSVAAASGDAVNQVRLIVGERSLAGAVVLGDQKLSRPLQELIACQADISPIRERLLQAGAPLGQLILEYWSAHRN